MPEASLTTSAVLQFLCVDHHQLPISLLFSLFFPPWVVFKQAPWNHEAKVWQQHLGPLMMLLPRKIKPLFISVEPWNTFRRGNTSFTKRYSCSPPPSSPPPSSVQIWDFSSLMDVPCPCRDRLNKPLLFQLCFSVYFSLSTKKDNNVIIFFFFHFFTSSQLSMLFAQWLNDLAQQHFSHAKEVNDLLSKRIIWKYKLQLSLILFFLNPERDDTQPKFRGEEPSPCVDRNLATLLSLCVRWARRKEDLAEIHFSCAAVNSQSRRQMRSEQRVNRVTAPDSSRCWNIPAILRLSLNKWVF